MLKYLLFAIMVVSLVNGQEDEEDRRFKKKKRPNYGSPCGFGRELSPAGYHESDRSLPLVAAVGGAAAGYFIGNKFQKPQQPVVNNYISTGGGFPCGGQAGPSLGGIGGGIGNHLASHVGPGGILSALGGLGGVRNGYSSYGGYGNGINWDRTIRQFNRNIVRPLANAWF